MLSLAQPLVALLLTALPAAQPALQDPEAPPPRSLRVNRAITHGVEFLEDRQASRGLWLGDEARYPGGLTAFCLYTLLKSGVRPKARSVRDGLAALTPVEFKSTYGVCARLFLYQALGGREPWKSRATECVRFLEENQSEGAWAYPWDAVDMSNVQFALFALRAAESIGVPVSDAVLEASAAAIWRWTHESGAFVYRSGDQPTTGITAATLAGILVLDEFAEDRPALAKLLSKHEKERALAHEWLVEHWDPARNTYGSAAWTPSFHFAYLWAVERYGDLSGERLLGEHDWYSEGAEWLVRNQRMDGSWGEHVEDTCFALLFLRRAVISGGADLEELYEGLDTLADTQRVEEVPRVRPGAPYVTDWAVAGPWQGKVERTGLFDPPFNPEKVKVKAKGKLGRRKWERCEIPAGSWVNLEELTGREGDHLLWALGTRIAYPPRKLARGESPPPTLEACLWFDFEDGWRVFVDGEEVTRGRRVQSPIKGDVAARFRLTPGEHEVLVLLEDVRGASVFGARLADPDGNALDAEIRLGFR